MTFSQTKKLQAVGLFLAYLGMALVLLYIAFELGAEWEARGGTWGRPPWLLGIIAVMSLPGLIWTMALASVPGTILYMIGKRLERRVRPTVTLDEAVRFSRLIRSWTKR